MHVLACFSCYQIILEKPHGSDGCDSSAVSSKGGASQSGRVKGYQMSRAGALQEHLVSLT